MFGKQFSGKLRGFGESLTKGKKGASEKRVLNIKIQYDFTEKLADSIGGHAPGIQKMLATAPAEGGRLTSSKIDLDTMEVGVLLNAGIDDALAVENSKSLTAIGKIAAAEGVNPTLEATADFELEDDEAGEALSFLHRNLGPNVKVRMDRKQTELPLDGQG